MTVAATTVQTPGSLTNGATTQFSFSFRVDDFGDIDAEDQLEVILASLSTGAETTLTKTTHYTVSINGDQDSSPGGSITTVSIYATGYRIYVRRNPSFLQNTSLQNQGAYQAEVVETTLDQVVKQVQDIRDRQLGSPHIGVQKGSSFDGRIRDQPRPGYLIAVGSGGAGYTQVANNGSSNLVTATGTTTPRLLADIVGETLTVLDFYGADGDATDDEAFQAWAAALKATGKPGFVPDGSYALTQQIDLQGADITVTCADNAEFDLSGFSGAGYAILLGGGDVFEDIGTIGTSIDKHDCAIALATGVGAELAVGDRYAIHDEVDYSWSSVDVDADREYHHKGQFLRVFAISGDTVINTSPAEDDYATASTLRILKPSFNKVIWRGGHFIGNGNTGFVAMLLAQAAEFEVSGLRGGSGCRQGVIHVIRSVDGVIDNPCFFDTGSDLITAGYNVLIAASQGVIVNDARLRSSRHAVTMGGSGGVYSFVNTDCWLQNSRLEGGPFAFDQHGGNRRCGIRDCDVYGGVTLGGDDVRAQRLRIFACSGDINDEATGSTAFRGVAMRVREMRSSAITIEDIDIYCNEDAIDADDGLITLEFGRPDFGGSINLKRIKVVSPVDIARVANIAFSGAGSARRCDLFVEDVTYEGGDNTASMIRIDYGTGTGAYAGAVAIGGLRNVGINGANLRSLVTKVSDFQVLEAPSTGVLLTFSQLDIATVEQRQDVFVSDGFVARSLNGGLAVIGNAETGKVVATIRDVVSHSNAQDSGTTAVLKSSIYVASMARADIDGCCVGDPQSVQTQSSQVRAVDVASLVLGRNTRLDTVLTNSYSGVDAVNNFTNLARTAPTTKTIASGVITADSSFHLVDTEAAAASDDLDTISGGSPGDLLVLKGASSSRDVTIKNATGNILCGSDFVFTSANDSITLMGIAGGFWMCLAKSDNA